MSVRAEMNKNRKAKQYGWICPKCDKVHAPDVKECDCVPRYVFINPMPCVPFTVPQPPYIVGDNWWEQPQITSTSRLYWYGVDNE